MGSRKLFVQIAVTVALLAAVNWAIAHGARNANTKQFTRKIAAAPPGSHTFLGNSLMAAGLNAEVFAAECPGSRPGNFALGATSPIEHLIIVKHLELSDRTMVVYGFFDLMLTAPPRVGWHDLSGNRTLGYHADLQTLIEEVADGDPLREFELRLTAAVPALVDRNGVWRRVELLRRQLGELGMPKKETNEFGRAEDFTELEGGDEEDFARRCLAATNAPLNRPARRLFGHVTASGAKLVVVEMPMPSAHRRKYNSRPEWRAYRAHLDGLLTKAGARVVAAGDWVPDDQFKDALHLNPAGAERFTRRLAAVLCDTERQPAQPR